MRTRRHKHPLRVESLESMTFLSGLPGLAVTEAPALVSAAAARQVQINATTKGVFHTTQSNPDTGTDYHVSTLGKSSGGAAVGVTGDLITPGFLAQGRTTGTLTVHTASGMLTLSVTGPLQPGFSPLPSTLGFAITGGTGAFAHNHSGSGTIAVQYHVTGTASGQSLKDFSKTGTISLIFKAGSAVV